MIPATTRLRAAPRLRAVGLAVLVMVAACEAGPGDGVGAWQGTVTETDAERVVRTTAGSVWGADAELVETAAIGVAEGDPAQMLGRVRSVQADDERIWLLDPANHVLRAYDLNGSHLFDVGRAGSGPGEFSRPWHMGMDGEGSVYVVDLAQGRLHRFSTDGELLEDWSNVRGMVQVSLGGDVFIQRPLPDRSRGLQWTMVRTTADGDTDDRLAFPVYETDPQALAINRNRLERMVVEDPDALEFGFVPFGRRVVRVMSPLGDAVAGVSDRYSFTVASRDGTSLIVERQVDPVPVESDEERWYRRRTIARWREVDPAWVWAGDDIPANKPAFSFLIPDRSGRTWVIRELAGVRLPDCDPDPPEYRGFVERPCWSQPLGADVFDREGRYLGATPVPPGMRFDVRPAIEGDRVVAVVEDPDGIVRVKRYELRGAS